MEVTNQPQVYVTEPGKSSRVMHTRQNVSDPRIQKNEGDYVDFSEVDDAEFEEAFDEEQAKAERDRQLDTIKKQQQEMNETAEKLEEIDSKYAKGAGKLFRIGAAVVGIAGTFVASKYSSKLLIETLKTAVKNPSLKVIPNTVESLKEPLSNLSKNAGVMFDNLMKNPKIKANVDKVVDSGFGKTVKSVLDNKFVKSCVEPIKNTLLSVKDIKINGKSIQKGVENTMAATTTGCVIIDDLTGRNNDKSSVDLATGV